MRQTVIPNQYIDSLIKAEREGNEQVLKEYRQTYTYEAIRDATKKGVGKTVSMSSFLEQKAKEYRLPTANYKFAELLTLMRYCTYEINSHFQPNVCLFLYFLGRLINNQIQNIKCNLVECEDDYRIVQLWSKFVAGKNYKYVYDNLIKYRKTYLFNPDFMEALTKTEYYLGYLSDKNTLLDYTFHRCILEAIDIIRNGTKYDIFLRCFTLRSRYFQALYDVLSKTSNESRLIFHNEIMDMVKCWYLRLLMFEARCGSADAVYGLYKDGVCAIGNAINAGSASAFIEYMEDSVKNVEYKYKKNYLREEEGEEVLDELYAAKRIYFCNSYEQIDRVEKCLDMIEWERQENRRRNIEMARQEIDAYREKLEEKSRWSNYFATGMPLSANEMEAFGTALGANYGLDIKTAGILQQNSITDLVDRKAKQLNNSFSDDNSSYFSTGSYRKKGIISKYPEALYKHINTKTEWFINPEKAAAQLFANNVWEQTDNPDNNIEIQLQKAMDNMEG